MITEYALDDAIIFQNKLNPELWELDGMMKPVIREKLLEMASSFQDFLNLDNLDIMDITVSGSNAAFTYTPHSDIDLHLVVRTPENEDALYIELFTAKKSLYNLTRNQKIKGFDVEFYVQNVNNPVTSMGIYSVKNNRWLSMPRRTEPTIDDLSVESKVQAFQERIEVVLRGSDIQLAQTTWSDLKDMRKAGLDAGGEFSPENVAFKILRTRGYQDKLYQFIIDQKDRELSLESIKV